MHNRIQKVEIIPYQPQFKEDFRAINYEWLQKSFEVTALDKKFFDDPQKEILAKGGFIYLARLGHKIVGSIALERISDKKYTLAKMGVSPAFQGRKIGRLLLEKTLEKAEELKLDELILHSHHTLVNALNLYSAYGFKFVEVTNPSFERATVQMRLQFNP